jgi:hypothetical protein
MDLKDTLRHEIEHTTQSGWNVMQGKIFEIRRCSKKQN